MTQSDKKPRNNARKARFMIIGAIIVCLGWTGIWHYAASRLQDELETRLKISGQRGQKIECSTLDVGGFPFRLSVDCKTVNMAFEREQLTVSGTRIFAIAQIYNPWHILIEAEGPFTATSPMLVSPLTLDWTQLQASLRVGTNQLRRLSIVGEKLQANYQSPSGKPVTVTSAHTEIHTRPTPDVPEGTNDIDLAADLMDVTSDDPLVELNKADITLRSTLKAAPLSPSGSVLQILANWQQSGGRLDITRAALSDPLGEIDVNGIIQLDPSLALVGHGELFTAIKAEGTSILTQMAAILSLIGTAETRNEKQGTKADFRIEDGRMKLEYLDLGPAPRLIR